MSGLACTIEHPVAGKIRTHGFALGPSDYGSEMTPAPLNGQHTIEMLALYGIAEEEIVGLLNQGVVRSISKRTADV